jgi:hypothetical protein
LEDLRSIGKVKEMDVEAIGKVPKSIIAKEKSQDVLNELQSHLSSKKAMIAHKEISDNRIGSHYSVVRNIASLKDYESNFVELRKNPNFISRTVLSKEASIDYFVNVGDKISLHFLFTKKGIS